MSSVIPLRPDPSGKLASNILHFGRVLREAGLPVGPSAVIDALDAAMMGQLRKREDFYWTLHTVFVKRREQHELFEQAFHVFWKKPKMLEQLMQLMYVQIARKPDLEKQKQAGFRRLAEAMFNPVGAPPQSARQQDTVELDATPTASTQEVLRRKDFEQMTLAEAAEAKQAIAKLKMSEKPLPTRRFRQSLAGPRIDMRGTMQQSLRRGGGIIDLVNREAKRRMPPLVVLCDISGSCADYSRMFLHFLHALANDRARVQVFLFGTRLTNVSRDMRKRDIDEALAKVSASVQDWAGGTRLAATLHEFNLKWARRVLGQGARVLLMTDGLAHGDTEELAVEMIRLRRSAKHITFLNPLLRYDGFAPHAEGIRAILPHVDEFRSVHSLKSLADLAASLAAPVKAEHDPMVWLERAHART